MNYVINQIEEIIESRNFLDNFQYFKNNYQWDYIIILMFINKLIKKNLDYDFF